MPPEFAFEDTSFPSDSRITIVSSDQATNLIHSTRRAFQIFEPWCQARPLSENTVITAIVDGARRQALGYIRALEMSLIVSQEGMGFSEDALHLCDELSADASPDQLLSFIGDLAHIAHTGHEKAKVTCDAFRSVRKGLLELTNKLGTAAVGTSRDAKKAHKSMRRHQIGASVAHHVASASKSLAIASATLAVVWPPLAIILPVALPMVIFAANGVKRKCEQTAASREQRVITCEDALEQLRATNADLMELIFSVSTFVDWWSSIKMSLATLKKIVLGLNEGELDKLWLERVRSRWSTLGAVYAFYYNEIHRLQDFYQPVVDGLTKLNPEGAASLSCQAFCETANDPDRCPDLSIILRHMANHGQQCWQAFDSLQLVATAMRKRHSERLQDKIEDLEYDLRKECDALVAYLQTLLPMRDNIKHRTQGEDSTLVIFTNKATWHDVMRSARIAQDIYDQHIHNVEKIRSDVVLRSLVLSSKSLSRSEDIEKLAGYFYPFASTERAPGTVKDALSAIESAMAEWTRDIDDMINFWLHPPAIVRAIQDGDVDGGGPSSWHRGVIECVSTFSGISDAIEARTSSRPRG